jgi:hypothetical protein
MTAPLPEIRRCAQCGQAAAVCVTEWQHSTMGVPSGIATRDFACQSCGAAFSLDPKRHLWIWGSMAALLSCTCVGAIHPAMVTLWKAWPYLKNPVVPGAEVPVIRYRATEPVRRCAACGDVAACVRVTQRRTSGIPTGTDYEYRCRGCKREFTTTSAGGHVFNAIAAPILFALGFGCLPFGIILWLLALAAIGLSALQLRDDVKNPRIALLDDPKGA